MDSTTNPSSQSDDSQTSIHQPVEIPSQSQTSSQNETHIDEEPEETLEDLIEKESKVIKNLDNPIETVNDIKMDKPSADELKKLMNIMSSMPKKDQINFLKQFAGMNLNPNNKNYNTVSDNHLGNMKLSRDELKEKIKTKRMEMQSGRRTKFAINYQHKKHMDKMDKHDDPIENTESQNTESQNTESQNTESQNTSQMLDEQYAPV